MTREAMNYNDLEHMLHQDAEPRMINFLLLKEITNNFSEERKIGSGGFGDVYMGVLSSQIIVAVKRLFRHNAHEDRPFQKEVECLMTVRHRNIARLLGYCASYKGEMLPKDGRLVLANNHEKLLCFEYLSNGNLLNQLKDASCGPEWHTRYLMIKGICHGLNHLHERHIIHLDLKPENILLDSDMSPKIVDFGLSRLLGEESQTSTQNVIGSPGYMAPEYWRGIITFPCDIYSLGVILKEMVTGHTSSHTIENELESWALRLGTSRVNTTLEQVRLCLEIAEECVSFNPERRPVMQDIIRRLNETETLEFSTENAASTTASRPLSLGRNAIMLSTRSLTIAWGHDEKYWRWTSRPDSRFGECAELISVYYLMVSRKIAPIDLPAAATSYTAYLVYKRAGNTLEGTVQKASTLHFDNIIASSKVSLHPKEGGPSSAHGVTYPVTRGDGWLELRLGEFSNEKPVTVQLLHEDPNKEMSGLIIDGMEIRRRP